MTKIKLGQTVRVDVLGFEEGTIVQVGTTHSKVSYDTINDPQVIEVLNKSIKIITIATQIVEAVKSLWSKICGK